MPRGQRTVSLIGCTDEQEWIKRRKSSETGARGGEASNPSAPSEPKCLEQWRSARGVDVLGVAMFREVTMMKAEFQQAASGCQRCGAFAGGGSWRRLQ